MLRKILIGLGIFIVGALAGHFGVPAKVVEKEHIVFRDRIVEKEVEKKTTEKKDNKVYVRIVTTKPDGTKTVETRIYDKDQTITIDKDSKDKTEVSSTVTDKEKTVTYSDGTFIGLGVDTKLGYDLIVEKRIVGPFYLGAFGSTSGLVGMHIGVSF